MAITFKEKGEALAVNHNTMGPTTYNSEIDTRELFWDTARQGVIGTSKRAHRLLVTTAKVF
jgi:hypothetical protein